MAFRYLRYLKQRQVQLIFGNSFAITIFLILLSLSGAIESLELDVFDDWVRKRPEKEFDENIVLVAAHESDVDYFKGWPISDRQLTGLLNEIKQQNPAVIGLDIIRDYPVIEGHGELVDFYRNTPNLIGIESLPSDYGRVSPPSVLKNLDQVAIANSVPDLDSLVRRAYILARVNGEDRYSLSGRLALDFLAQQKNIELEEAVEKPDSSKLGKSIFHPLRANDGAYAKADVSGFQILVNYRGTPCYVRNQYQCKYELVSFEEVLENKIPSDLFKNKIVIVGVIGSSFNDFHETSYTDGVDNLFAGIELNASTTSQIIEAALTGEGLFQFWPDTFEWVWLLGWTLIGSSFGVYIFTSKNKLVWLFFPLLVLGLYCSTYWLFLNNIWIPFVTPLAGLMLAIATSTALIAQSAKKIRSTFSRYISDEIVGTLLDQPTGLSLGGERRTVTILMSDLRGFTSLSESLNPEKMIEILNLYLSEMANVITSYSGTIDEFMGDGILVLFGAPLQRPDDPERAIACAIAMQLALMSVNQKIIEMGLIPLEMGIGVNTGEVLVGNIGSEKRTKYAVVGSQVNLTARIESYTVGGQIFISEYTHKLLESKLAIRSQQDVSPKGVKQPITIYEVEGIRGKYNLYLPHKVEKLIYNPR